MADPKIYGNTIAVDGDNLVAYDKVIGSAGNDVIHSSGAPTSAQTIYGGDGNDVITGVHGADKLYGEAGNDTLTGVAGSAGAAAQTAVNNATTARDNAAIANTAALLADAAQLAVADAKTAADTLAADLTSVTKQAAFVTAVTDANTAILAADVAGKDVATYSAAQTAVADLVTAKNNLVTDSYADATAAVAAAGIAKTNADSFGSATLATTPTGTTALLAAAQLTLDNANAALAAANGGNYLDGGIGNDVLTAGTKGDTLIGGLGNDAITAGNGTDTIIFNAGDGKDTINGFGATDKLKFNVNADQLVFTVDATTNNVTKIGIAGTTDEVAFAAPGVVLTAASILTKDSGAFVFGNTGTNATTATNKYVIATDETLAVQYFGTEKLVDGTAVASKTVNTNDANVDLNSTVFRGIEKITLTDTTADAAGFALIGNAKDNEITGSTGADTLAGGAGKDTLDGGAGKDTYKFAKGDGVDHIATAAAELGDDTVVLSGLARDAVTFKTNNGALEVNVTGTTDKLIIDHWTDAAKAAGVTFDANGTKVVVKGTVATGPVATGAYDSAALLVGTATQTHDVVTAEGMNRIDLSVATQFQSVEDIDNSNNSFGGSTLRGNSGDNAIQAINNVSVTTTSGDQLWGGLGNDTLVGGQGKDTFWYGKNEGNKIITRNDLNYTGDVIKLYGIKAADVTYTLTNSTMVMTFQGSTDTVTIQGWNATDATKNPKFTTDDITTAFSVNQGSSLSYGKDGATSTFTGTTAITDQVIVAADAGAVKIKLEDTTKFQSVEYIDNQLNAVGGSILAGNASSNQIYASNINSNDPIFATVAQGDQLWGGAGNVSDTLVGGNNVAADTFWYYQGNGQDLIQQAQKDDVIKLANVNFADVKFELVNNNLEVTFKNDTQSKVTIQNWNTSNAPKFTTADRTTAFAVSVANGNNVTYAKDGVLVGTADVDTLVTDTNTAAGTRIDLANYSGIENITDAANIANLVLRGDSANNVITAGTAGASLWGGKGDDTLVGAVAAKDLFWYGKDQGNKVIDLNGDVTGTDVIKLYDINAADVSYKLVAATTLEISFKGSTDKLTVKNWNDGTKFTTLDKADAFAIAVANFAANPDGTYDITYATDVTPKGTAAVDTLVTTAAIAGTKIDLANYSGIENINNASNTNAGIVLRGNAADNVITASTTTSDNIWGGLGNDTIVAGTATNIWYGKDQGNKVIKSASSDDLVNFYDVNHADLSYSFSGNDLVVGVKGSSTNTVTIAGWNDATSTHPTFKTLDNAAFTLQFGTDASDASLLAASGQYLYAGKGDDTITYATGVKLIDGQEGTNTVVNTSATKIDLTDTTFANIQNITGSTTIGAHLNGDDKNNTITAGTFGGDNLWGRGGNDTLIGNTAADTFWFGKDEGNDVVKAFNAAADNVMLYTQGLQASDVKVAFANYDNDLVLTVGTGTLTIQDGASLVAGGNAVFTMADGHSYSVGAKSATDSTLVLK